MILYYFQWQADNSVYIAKLLLVDMVSHDLAFGHVTVVTWFVYFDHVISEARQCILK